MEKLKVKQVVQEVVRDLAIIVFLCGLVVFPIVFVLFMAHVIIIIGQ